MQCLLGEANLLGIQSKLSADIFPDVNDTLIHQIKIFPSYIQPYCYRSVKSRPMYNFSQSVAISKAGRVLQRAIRVITSLTSYSNTSIHVWKLHIMSYNVKSH